MSRRLLSVCLLCANMLCASLQCGVWAVGLSAAGLYAAEPIDSPKSPEAVVQQLTEAGGKIDAKNGQITKLYFSPSHQLTADHWRTIGALSELREMTLYNKCSLNDETLPLLAGLTNLEKFAVDGAHLTDQGMKPFAAWKNLKRITFFHVFWGKQNFNGVGLSVFAELPQLESFGMGGSTLTDDGLAALSKAKQLQDLNIWHTGVTDSGVQHLKNLTNLRSLRLASQFNLLLTDAALPHIAEIPSLETLKLGEMRVTYEAGLKHLERLPRLAQLELNQVACSPEDLAKLQTALPSLKIKHTPPTADELSRLEKAEARAASQKR